MEKNDELMKSLADILGKDLNNPEEKEEIALMINSDISKSEDEEEDSKDEGEDGSDEDMEKALKKAMDEATKKYDDFKKGCKGKVEKSEGEDEEKIEKSEDLGEKESKQDLIAKSIGIALSNQKQEVDSKFDSIEKSFSDSLAQLTDKLSLVAEEVSKIGSNTPPTKAFLGSNEAILEKAIEQAQGGIKQGNEIYYSQKTSRNEIGEALGDVIAEKDGTALAKSLESSLSNFIAGSSELDSKAKEILHKEKGIIVT